MTDKPLVSFDYAIKYLLKDKGDYEIVEGFISALLKSQGYSDVKIIGLLDTESNSEDSISKRSLADVVVEDKDHNRYIIEIERNIKDTFLHKACFNTSRLIIDHLAEGMDSVNIVKVFHISLLYFPVGNGAVHHGQTIFREIESQERLTVHIKHPITQEVVDATDILPEYFFISVPLFNDRLEKEIDDWLYVLKYDNVPPTFHSPYMQKVADKLSILKMTQAEREHYVYYIKSLYSDRDELQAAEARGEARGEEMGITKGERRTKESIARKMYEKGESVEDICEFTELSCDEIRALLPKS